MPFLRSTTIDTIMSKPAFVDYDANLIEVTKKLLQTKKGCVFVTRVGKLIGIITDRDIQRLILRDAGIISPDITAKEFMVKPVVKIFRSASIEEADQLMHDEKVNRLAIIDKVNPDKVIGFVDYNTTHAEIVTKFAKSLIERRKYFDG
ncbi:MAG TPA: CBS domain-containing protein [candidate division Zixibacteria bacterium]|nr:CBS domain-containing protein [candidate division Zixibacteria bacterium]